MKNLKIRKLASTLLIPVLFGMQTTMPSYAEDIEIKIYVSVNGDDQNDGRQLTSAVRTPARAVELERLYKEKGRTVQVIFKGGTYSLESTMTLTKKDSGTADAPVVFRAYEGERVKFTTGKNIAPESFVVSTDERIADSAKGKVYEADLSGFEGTITGALTDTLSADGTLLQLAKYPNDGMLTLEANGDGTYQIPADKQAAWGSNRELYQEYQQNSYSWSIGNVSEITDTTIKANSEQVIIYNALGDVDMPGEYYIDKTQKKLFYYPKKDISQSSVYLSNVSGNIISVEGASNIKFEGIDMMCANNNGFYIKDSSNITIYDSVISSLGDAGVRAENVTGLLVCKSSVYDMKGAAMNINGGDNVKLTSSGNIIRNCRIHDFAKVYRTSKGVGVALSGAGNTFVHNEVYKCPATAVSLSGNDNLIEYNRIHDTMLNVWDAGAVYMGRSWIDRGNVIRNNYIYNSLNTVDYTHVTDAIMYGAGTDNQAIYADDIQSGVTITGNIAYNISRAWIVGGGSDNIISDNIAIDCRRGILYDNRGEGWAYSHLDELYPYRGDIYKNYKKLFYSNYGNLQEGETLQPNTDFDVELWKNKYNGFTELIERVNTYDIAVKDMTSYEEYADARRKVIQSTIGKVYNRTMENNVYVGEFADLYLDTVNKPHTTFISVADAYNFDGTKAAVSDSANAVMSKEAAGISISDYEITVSGNVSEGISKSTADMGVVEDEYVPTYSKNEFDVNAGNRFTAVAALYDTNGALKNVQTFDECYFYDGQVLNLDVSVPEDAGDDWYAVIMMWDGINGMIPVLHQKLTLLK